MNELIIYIVVSFLIIIFVVSLIINIKRRKQAKREEALAAMVDSMNIRRASINTGYLEKFFFRTIEQLVYSLYSLNFQFVPMQNMFPEFYAKWVNDLRREYGLGIKKLINDFRMEKARVVKQEGFSIYAVTQIEVEAQFYVDYNYFHPTMNSRIRKQFKQCFVFVNTNKGWLLERVLPETVIKKEEIPINRL